MFYTDAITFFQSVHGLFQKGYLCDYTIVAEGQSFKTHRTILASVSDYFRVMLTGQMIEAKQDHVELKGVSANAMTELLSFAYTGRLSLSMDDVVDTLSGASHLQMQGALELCSEFLRTEVSRKTCVDILNMAEMYSLSKVISIGLDYVINHFEKVIESDQFYKLHRDHLIVILRSNRICISSELQLFHLVRRWVEFDSQERLKFVYPLLEHVRFALMTPEELVDQVANSNLVAADDRCRVLLDEAFQYHVLPTRHPQLQTPRTQIRNKPCMIALGGRYGINIGDKYNSNKMFALAKSKWHLVSKSDINFLYAAVCVLDNFLYVCGGMGKPIHARASCYRYDPRTSTWTQLSHMKTRRQSFPLIAFGKKLYAFGGGTPVDSTIRHPPTVASEVYSVDKNQWSSIAPLPEKRKSTAACVLNEKIFVSGGRTDDETVSTLWCYDPCNDAWQNKQCMIVPHAGHAMSAINHKLYVTDRMDLAVECYCPTLDEWTKIVGPTPSVHSGIARPAVMGPWVYFISCYTADGDQKCKRFNVVTLQTEELADFPESVHCVAGIPLTLSQALFSDANNNDGQN